MILTPIAPVKITIAPTDRSMLPIMTTKVLPRQAIKRLAVWPLKAVTLRMVAKEGVSIEKKTISERTTKPGSQKERILSVPKYDFNWQLYYEYADPLHLPKGSRIDCVAHYDNSTRNPNNPNPYSVVMFGLQTWEEMMVGFVDYYYDGERVGAAGHRNESHGPLVKQ